MPALGERRPRSARALAILVLLALSLVIIDRAGPSAPTAPVRGALRDVAGGLSGSLHGLHLGSGNERTRSLEAENRRLEAQLQDVQGQLEQAADVRRERDELRATLDLQVPDDLGKIAARVVAVGASNFDATAEIDKGSDAGIATGMPVVTPKGLVGRVIQVSRSHATLLLVSDTTFQVGVRFSEAGDVGVAVGEGLQHDQRVDLIDLSSAVRQGEVAVTSGQQHGLFPAGIPVGVVSSIAAGSHDLRKSVRLSPAADLGHLDIVSVLQWQPR